MHADDLQAGRRELGYGQGDEHIWEGIEGRLALFDGEGGESYSRWTFGSLFFTQGSKRM